MYIKLFRSLTTDIYSLTLSSPSRLRRTLLDLKDYLNINYFKYYNRIIKILVESGSSPPSLISSATIHQPSTRAGGSASSQNIPLAHRTGSIGRFQPCASFGFFQIVHLPFTKITFLDTCQKMVSTSPLQDLIWGRDMHGPTSLLSHNFIKVCFNFFLLFRVVSFKWLCFKSLMSLILNGHFLCYRSCLVLRSSSSKLSCTNWRAHACIQCLNLTSSA